MSLNSLIARILKQTATYWAKTGTDGYGKATFTSPAALLVRWTDKQEIIRNAQGNEAVSNAQVIVGQDVTIGGYLYLGTNAGADPTVVSGAREIRAFDKIPDKKAIYFFRKAYL